MNNKDELYHYGVKGMKWKGHVYAQRPAPTGRRMSRGQVPSETKQTNNSQASNKKMSIKKKVVIGTAAAVGFLAAGYGAYKLSKYIKGEAGRRSLEAGQKYANEHFFSKAANAFGRSDLTTSQQYERYNSMREAGRNTIVNTHNRTKKVSGSLREAVRYLRNPEYYDVDGRFSGRRYE